MSMAKIVIFVNAVCFCGLAFTALTAKPRNLARWAFAGGMAVLVMESVFNALSIQSTWLEQRMFWQRLRWIFAGFVPLPWLIFSLSYSRGNYRELLKASIPALAIFTVVPTVLVVGFSHAVVTRAAGEEGGYAVMLLGWPGIALNLLNLAGSILFALNLEATFRASVGTMRWRIKYMVIGLALLFGARIYSSAQILLYSGVNPGSIEVEAIAQFGACCLIAFSLARSRFSDVDVYPSQAVLHRSFTVLLVGSYLFAVGLLAKLVGVVVGEEAFPLAAFVVMLGLVGMCVILLSDRVRQALRRFISRHFRRPLYDYRKVWTAFNERMSSLINEVDFCRDVARLVAETFEALSVTVWLIDQERKEINFAASTVVSEATAQTLLKSPLGIDEIIQFLLQNPDPVDIDKLPKTDLALLKRISPDFFPQGGDRMCVPLVSGGQLLGVMALGDRVAGVPFTEEERELLKCIGDQVAASLRNIKLSQRLLEAKEIEAFQTMSAFFVHDLKNTASSLSLMLQNLPKHFDDASFREDALRAVARSVARINHLIASLGVIRQELKVDHKETDLNRFLESTLEGLESAGTLPIVKKLGVLPTVRLDAELIQKVITNLVLNARDAVGAAGKIEIETFERDGWAVLSVSDNGIGMSPEFLRNSLFRPFQTTKKKGMGIGAFHSRRIVEAHRGRIEVESTVGKGTTIRVFLPRRGME